MRVTVLLLMATLASAAGSDYDAPATFQASKILPANVVKGPHHTVSEDVKGDGFYLLFHIESDFGAIDAEGRTVLQTRIREVDALRQLSEVSKGEVFAKAAGGAVLNVGKGVASVVKDPEGTVKGIGAGVKRFGGNLGRKTKRGADSVTKDDKKPEGADKSTDEKAAAASVSAADSVLGVNGAARKWAQKVNVDPYTTNPVLHKALVDLGRIDAAGSIATKVIVPIPMVVSTTASVGGLVWSADPEAIRKTNEKQLAELGVPKDVAARYFVNANYTVTGHVRFIAALYAVKAKGIVDYIDGAAEADDEREALFFVESAEMLAGLHKTAPVAAILEDSRAMIAKTAGSAVALLPFDLLRWTEALQKSAIEIGSRAKKELGATALEVQLLGTATPAAKQGLTGAGWRIREHVVAGLSVPPVD